MFTAAAFLLACLSLFTIPLLNVHDEVLQQLMNDAAAVASI